MMSTLIENLFNFRSKNEMTFTPPEFPAEPTAESEATTPMLPVAPVIQLPPPIERQIPPRLAKMSPTKTPVDIPIKLIDMLSYCRPHDSKGEAEFINEYVLTYCNQMLCSADEKDIFAYITSVPCKDGTASTTLWSAHTDTVHWSVADVTQKVCVDHDKGVLYKMDGKPLGADNGAGVWLLIEMIKAKVPGTYIFHRGEERGGIGSKAVAKHFPKWLEDFTHAIAFDRKDTCSVITHQMVGRCCSDEFANQMASLLTDDDCTYILAPDDTGSFTDTANYIDIIAECTNISVGYYNEHGGDEILEVAYLLYLKDRLIALFGSDTPPDLIVSRTPGEFEARPSYGVYGGYAGYKSQNAGWDNWVKDALNDDPVVVNDEYDIDNMRWRDLVNWVKNSEPEDVADMLSLLAAKVLYTPRKEVKK